MGKAHSSSGRESYTKSARGGDYLCFKMNARADDSCFLFYIIQSIMTPATMPSIIASDWNPGIRPEGARASLGPMYMFPMLFLTYSSVRANLPYSNPRICTGC